MFLSHASHPDRFEVNSISPTYKTILRLEPRLDLSSRENLAANLALDARCGLTSLVQEIGKIVLFVGLFLVVAGAILWRFPSAFGWIGKLPGDISVQKGNFSFYFPVVTCIVISILLTLLFWLFRK
jgi:hypothetical protein